MNDVVLIRASMRSADLGNLSSQIARLEEAEVDGLHFDVMDGRFGPEISMGVMFVRGLRKYTKLPFDVHLWVEAPLERCIDSYVDAGADCVIVHAEACQDIAATLKHIRSRGIKTGLAFNPATNPLSLESYFSLCDEINVMTIAPDTAGQVNEKGVENLKITAQLLAKQTRPVLLQADGAVSSKTRDLFVESGAGSLVAGYPIFSQADFRNAVSQLRLGSSLRSGVV